MTLVQRPVTPQLMGRTEHQATGITEYTDPKQTCTCTDPDLHRLVELINSGMGQVEASRLLWGDGGSTRPLTAAEAPVVRSQAPAPTITPTSTPGARFPWLRRAKARR
jgi:hypothetical protein